MKLRKLLVGCSHKPVMFEYLLGWRVSVTAKKAKVVATDCAVFDPNTLEFRDQVCI